MLILDHNQIPRRFSFKQYLRQPTNSGAIISHCWFSRKQAFTQVVDRRSDTVAVYKMLNYDAHILVSKARQVSATDGTWELDLEQLPEERDAWVGDYTDSVYQGIGYYVRSIPLTLMVEERLACVDDLSVNLYFADQHFKDMPLDILEELQRYKLI